ncbi:CORD and CS domain-containing protein [Colletotrichum tofieldiae]|nr:CORD and CS domain-containing protein [Colletotrichum tofieldiae]
MAEKCVHQGCGKLYTDAEEPCVYHPGPPIFHEGQKALHNRPAPKIEQKPQADPAAAPSLLDQLAASTIEPGRKPLSQATQAAPSPPPPPPESESDDASLEIPDGATCRRKACSATYRKGASRDGESCVHHPGVPIFHEGSKGYSCCKRRVLEFDQFMKIEGCKTKNRHLFIGSGKKKNAAAAGGEEKLDTVRTDFYQTPSTVIASFFLKKIAKDSAKIEFKSQSIALDLPTSDSPPKRYTTEVPLFAPIDVEKSTFKVLGTKLEVNLAKAGGESWPVLRSDDRLTGEILQIGKAGRLQ